MEIYRRSDLTKEEFDAGWDVIKNVIVGRGFEIPNDGDYRVDIKHGDDVVSVYVPNILKVSYDENEVAIRMREGDGHDIVIIIGTRPMRIFVGF